MDIEDVYQARERIRSSVERTPLIRGRSIEAHLGIGRVYLKCENFQRTRSFKIRGAMNVLQTLSPMERSSGVVTRSSGNFAQALADAAEQLGIDACIVMPENAPQVKIDSTKKHGAELVLHGKTHDEGNAKVQEISQEQGRTIISPFDMEAVMAGQGTIALEILEELPGVFSFFCPVGGGGLLSGCALALKNLRPETKIFAVEPEGGRDFSISFQRGVRTERREIDTIADGLRTPVVGEHCWPILKECVDEVLLVSDEQIVSTMSLLYRELGIVVEPSAAVSLAGLLFSAPSPRPDDTAVSLLSGGNVDLQRFFEWIKKDS